ncbi:uncharacterized protein A4U43_UnF6010 [Asparagus officinalis]|uniref:Uncharacterized protein n=1 Tax=Asparagus officinalis TaxID=4686 RepID=A0A1R3L6K1_ASPOF|nr:uncharacterized protein A4U43_UnF6010 [Asparagus officinalis]
MRQVLSNEVARARYDMLCNFPETRSPSWRRRYAHSPESYDTFYKWAKLRQHMQYERHKKEQATSRQYHTNPHQETSGYERGSFSEVLRFAFVTLFFMQIVGHRASLALCGAIALLDQQLDVGYKMGYVIAMLFGGRGGILLALCIYFASWLCGKKSSSIVALVVLAMWVGANIARFAPLPQGFVCSAHLKLRAST